MLLCGIRDLYRDSQVLQPERMVTMKVLVACEESQAVCKEFRRLGHEAYSCDIQECSGGHPEWHIMGDALQSIKGGADNHNGRTNT